MTKKPNSNGKLVRKLCNYIVEKLLSTSRYIGVNMCSQHRNKEDREAGKDMHAPTVKYSDFRLFSIAFLLCLKEYLLFRKSSINNAVLYPFWIEVT